MPHMKGLIVNLSACMKNKNTIIIISLLGLFAIGYLVSVFRNPQTEEPSTPLAYFANEGSLSGVFGKDFTAKIQIPKDIISLEVRLDDQVLIKQSSLSREFVLKIKNADLSIGAHRLSIKARSNAKEETEDERILYILSDVVPQIWTLSIINQYPHNDSSFTQGLAFSENKLFEGTGDPNNLGATMVGEVELQTGKILRKKSVAAPVFGEGITLVGEKIYQITWQNSTCYVYDKSNLELLNQFTYTGEGWGLTYDGKHLIMSDGSEVLTFRDPKTFKEIRKIEAYTHEGGITKLNELEYINGLIYANVWTSNIIAVIEPTTGRVIATIDATEAVQKGKGSGEVLNGIAYNEQSNKTYITGKFWPNLFEVKFLQPKSAQ